MAFTLSTRSSRELATCDERLQRIVARALESVDLTVLVGFRGKEDQDKAYLARRSKLRWPNSKHNRSPSHAMDIAPWPLMWPDQEKDPGKQMSLYMQYAMFAGRILQIAADMDIKLRWGGNFDRDDLPFEVGETDLVHFELDEL